MTDKTMVSVRLDGVTIRVACPHESVDNETLKDIVLESMKVGERQYLTSSICGPYAHPDNRPEFEVLVDAFEHDIEIEDDDREDVEELFDPELTWWKDCLAQLKEQDDA
ncbi:MAG: hypothetical protein EBY40_01075 [Marivivens sp.]|nr:hypothetical protein [Marivivens sp.]NBT49987.1 hypothetical protein [Marivivens sp.]NCW67370.1 hypothetical protein [Marivivens sp.]NDH01700.1 hypothetical protein [Marivivens sp.]